MAKTDRPSRPCPLCPKCGGSPDPMINGPTQAMCRNADCNVLFWNPSLPDGGASNLQEIDLE